MLYASQDGPTHGRIPDEWALTFERLDEPTEQETAELRETVARMDATYISSGVYRPEDVTRGRFGPEGWSLDLPEIEPIDREEEDRKAAQRQAEMMAAMGGGREGEPDDGDESESQDRADAASDGVFVVVPAPAPPRTLLDAVERALGQRIEPPGVEPHITVLYVGDGIRPRFELAEVVATVTDEAADVHPSPLGRGSVVAFPPGPRGVPVVIEFGDAWNLGSIHERLLRRLAHRITAKQRRTFRAHLTLGYAPVPLTPETQAALLAVDASSVLVPVSELRVHAGGRVVASVAVGA